MNKALEKLIAEQDAKSAEYLIDLDGYEIYGFDFGKDAVVGMPRFASCKGDECRLITGTEALKIIKILSDDD